jgi:hypothetical protein
MKDILDEIKNGIDNGSSIIKQKLREQCIENALETIEQRGLKREQFSDEEFEIIVKEEEDKLISDIKDKSLVASLGGLVLTLFTGI